MRVCVSEGACHKQKIGDRESEKARVEMGIGAHKERHKVNKRKIKICMER